MEPDFSPEELRRIIRQLEERGFVVKKRPNYIKKTFDIDKVLLDEVNQLRHDLNTSLRDVFSEALQLWLARHSR